MSYLSVVLAQFLYTMSDVWKKTILGEQGFTAGTFVKPAFLLALAVAAVGFAFQMHALSRLDLSRTIITMGLLAIIFSAAAGAIFFREQFNLWNLVGLGLACAAIILVNVR